MVASDTTQTQGPIRLYGWTKWEDGKWPIRALLYGQMVGRALPVVKFFLSDLYHDAHWINDTVNGPTEFWWMVRLNGTNIGDSAITMEHISGSEPRVLYHVALAEADGEWFATFSEFVRIEGS
jgi:hypothetical protein